MFLYILKDVSYKNEFSPFGGNTIVLTKDDKIEIAKKFGVTDRTFKSFIKTVRDLELLAKINNTTFQINDIFMTCGGDFLVKPKTPNEPFDWENASEEERRIHAEEMMEKKAENERLEEKRIQKREEMFKKRPNMSQFFNKTTTSKEGDKNEE